ncbi:MAG: hypothetical protein ACFFDF_13205 [Candidatus Odinarchaeota archaeon]
MTLKNEEMIIEIKVIKPFECEQCGRKLRVCNKYLKKMNELQDFGVYTYYCNICKLTYYVFKIINKRGMKYD